MLSEVERFWAKVEKIPFTTCWLWSGAVRWSADGSPYGAFSPSHAAAHGAHRYSYELVNGPIPTGLTIDHLCKTTLCVRPDHLRAVTMKVNVLAGDGPTAQNARKTHCKNGHPYLGDNLRIRVKSDRTYRLCATCHRVRAALDRRRSKRALAGESGQLRPCPNAVSWCGGPDRYGDTCATCLATWTEEAKEKA